MRVRKATASQVPVVASPAAQWKPVSTPRAVATPLPPLKPKYSG